MTSLLTAALRQVAHWSPFPLAVNARTAHYPHWRS